MAKLIGWQARAAGCIAVAVLSAGCAGVDASASGAPCLDDTQACVARRTALVQSLSADQTHGWITQPADSLTVASGVRLFAYQNVRDRLNCAELAHGIADLAAAKQDLAQGPAPGQTMQRHNQIRAMTEDVRVSLGAARSRKCGAAAGI